MKKIAILRLSALGDVVLVVPLVNVLLKAFPQAEISWITTKQTVDLLGPIKRVKWVVVEKPKSLTAILSNRKALRGHRFDALLLLQASFSAHLVSLHVSAQRKIGFDSRRGKDFHGLFIKESISYEDQHFVDAYLSFARKLGVVGHVVSWEGAFSNMDLEWVDRELPEVFPMVGLATSPSKKERRWPKENYRNVIEYLIEKKITVFLFGGNSKEEKSFNSQLAAPFSGKVKDFTGQTTLPQWSALISSVNLLIAPDTGCVHMARALGTKVVGLYAVANPSLTGPYMEQEYCVNKYDEALNKYLPGSKAKDYHLRVHHPDAMSLVYSNEVIEMVDRALESLSE